MSDGFIGIDEPTSIDKKADTEELTVGANTVHRERIEVTGAAADEIAVVTDTTPASDAFGLVVRAAGTTPVSGTVTANLSATDNAVLDDIAADTESIKTAVELLDNAIAGNELQVDIVSSALPTGASTLAEQQSQTTHLATIAGDTTDIEAAVELLDDSVATLGTTTYTEAATKALIIGAVRNDAQTTLVDTDNEVAPLQVNSTGRLKVQSVPVQVDGDGYGGAGTPGVGILGAYQASPSNLSNADMAILSLAIDRRLRTQTTLTDGTDVADVLDLTNANPLAVAILDGSGDQITSFGGGTQYTEGDTDATIAGNAMLMEAGSNTLVPVQGNTTDGVLVNLGSNNDVTVAGVSTAANQSTMIGHLDGVEGLLGTIDGDTGNISTKIDTLAGAVAGTEVQVDVLTLPPIPAGTNNIGDVDILTIAAGDNNIGNVDIVTMPNVTLAAGTNTNEVVGDVAQDAAVAGNPVLIGGRASATEPTQMSNDGDAVYLWTTLRGALHTATFPHRGLIGDPYTLTSKTVQQTTTQTGTDVLTPSSGKKLVITKCIIACGGTTAATVQLWFGANADTTYTRGTDLAIFDGEFAPSATLKPGIVLEGPFIASAADHEVHLTTSAGITITVTLWYYEV